MKSKIGPKSATIYSESPVCTFLVLCQQCVWSCHPESLQVCQKHVLIHHSFWAVLENHGCAGSVTSSRYLLLTDIKFPSLSSNQEVSWPNKKWFALRTKPNSQGDFYESHEKNPVEFGLSPVWKLKWLFHTFTWMWQKWILSPSQWCAKNIWIRNKDTWFNEGIA